MTYTVDINHYTTLCMQLKYLVKYSTFSSYSGNDWPTDENEQPTELDAQIQPPDLELVLTLFNEIHMYT